MNLVYRLILNIVLCAFWATCIYFAYDLAKTGHSFWTWCWFFAGLLTSIRHDKNNPEPPSQTAKAKK